RSPQTTKSGGRHGRRSRDAWEGGGVSRDSGNRHRKTEKQHSKIKGHGTGAASSRCLHKVFISTPFFESGTDFRQLIEQTHFIASRPLPSATKYDRKFARTVSTGAPGNYKW